MKNIQVGDLKPNANQPGPAPSDCQGYSKVIPGVRPGFGSLTSLGPSFLSETRVLPDDLRSLHLKSCNSKYILISIATHLPFREPH